MCSWDLFLLCKGVKYTISSQRFSIWKAKSIAWPVSYVGCGILAIWKAFRQGRTVSKSLSVVSRYIVLLEGIFSGHELLVHLGYRQHSLIWNCPSRFCSIRYETLQHFCSLQHCHRTLRVIRVLLWLIRYKDSLSYRYNQHLSLQLSAEQAVLKKTFLQCDGNSIPLIQRVLLGWISVD